MAKQKKIGIISEDASDFDSLIKIIPKIRKRNYVFRRALGKGCGRIKSKSSRFCKVLHDQGCTALIVIRDSDGETVSKLKKEVANAMNPNPISNHVIIIAVQELEAWLLADIEAVHKVFSNARKAPKEISSPESISGPKEFLRKLVKQKYNKEYLNSVHNPKIASGINIEKLKAKCSTFKDLVNFVSA
ncbi:MAG: DUF4276 family protein [Gammaproteobacteria bacterium]|nr:DUF4276 family protein [Gammaproteobacteria bacterium]